VKQPRKTVGVYEAPRRAKWPRILAAIFTVLVGILVAIGFGSRFFGEARAAEAHESISSTWTPLWTDR
jgi:hypothetical protein